MYRNLDPDKIVGTLQLLHRRIEERFPLSGIAHVCEEICIIADTSKQRATLIAKANYSLRVFVLLIIIAIVFALIYSISLIDIKPKSIDIGGLVQIAEAAINNVVLIGAALFFLVTVENRIKRSRALDALYELRTIAHILDMHQLTKDPGRVNQNVRQTHSSPKIEMSTYELMRYLDYCSEMLSLTGKIAALYSQNFKDPIVLSAVNDFENLTTGLCRKIWQKIMILHKHDDALVSDKKLTELDA